MRYFLLHVTTFLPLCAKLILAPWGLKIAWTMYLFFTYVLLEHKQFNGYPVTVFRNLQRQSECAMMLALPLAHWVSHWMAPFPFALVLWKFDIDELVYSLFCFPMYKYDPIQILTVTLSVMSAHMYTDETVVGIEGWHRAVHRRIIFRFVQVTALTCAFESLRVRIVLLFASAVLKAMVWFQTEGENPSDFKDDVPVRLLPGKRHRL